MDAGLLQTDEELTDRGVIPTLFAFFICGPRRPRLQRLERLEVFVDRSLREPVRESVARLSGGWYPREIGSHPGAALRAVLGRLRRRLARAAGSVASSR
jgi:hypothetical protein